MILMKGYKPYSVMVGETFERTQPAVYSDSNGRPPLLFWRTFSIPADLQTKSITSPAHAGQTPLGEL